MSDSEGVKQLIRAHGVPDSVRTWRAREYGYFGKWRGCFVKVGRLDDRRWYVQRDDHEVTGPYRAELYWTEADAVRVARAVMTDAEPALAEAGYGKFSEVY